MTSRRRLFACILSAGIMAAALPPGVASASEGKGESKPEPYLELPTLTATVIRADGRRGVLTVQATVYIPGKTLQAKAPKYLPMLLDAYVPAMQEWAYALSPGRVPNVDLLSAALQGPTDKVLGKGGVVLLGGVMIN